MFVRKVLIKYFIIIVVHFIGYLYIIEFSLCHHRNTSFLFFPHLQNEVRVIPRRHNFSHLSPSSTENNETLELYLCKNDKDHSGLSVNPSKFMLLFWSKDFSSSRVCKQSIFPFTKIKFTPYFLHMLLLHSISKYKACSKKTELLL
jgi:hypothetical protein